MWYHRNAQHFDKGGITSRANALVVLKITINHAISVKNRRSMKLLHAQCHIARKTIADWGIAECWPTHALLRGGEPIFIPLETAQWLAYPAMAMTRAFDELEDASLGRVDRGVQCPAVHSGREISRRDADTPHHFIPRTGCSFRNFRLKQYVKIGCHVFAAKILFSRMTPKLPRDGLVIIVSYYCFTDNYLEI